MKIFQSMRQVGQGVGTFLKGSGSFLKNHAVNLVTSTATAYTVSSLMGLSSAAVISAMVLSPLFRFTYTEIRMAQKNKKEERRAEREEHELEEEDSDHRRYARLKPQMDELNSHLENDVLQQKIVFEAVKELEREEEAEKAKKAERDKKAKAYTEEEPEEHKVEESEKPQNLKMEKISAALKNIDTFSPQVAHRVMIREEAMKCGREAIQAKKKNTHRPAIKNKTTPAEVAKDIQKTWGEFVSRMKPKTNSPTSAVVGKSAPAPEEQPKEVDKSAPAPEGQPKEKNYAKYFMAFKIGQGFVKRFAEIYGLVDAVTSMTYSDQEEPSPETWWRLVPSVGAGLYGAVRGAQQASQELRSKDLADLKQKEYLKKKELRQETLESFEKIIAKLNDPSRKKQVGDSREVDEKHVDRKSSIASKTDTVLTQASSFGGSSSSSVATSPSFISTSSSRMSEHAFSSPKPKQEPKKESKKEPILPPVKGAGKRNQVSPTPPFTSIYGYRA